MNQTVSRLRFTVNDGARSCAAGAYNFSDSKLQRRLGALAALGPAELHALLELERGAMPLAPNSPIVHEGETSTQLYVLREGWAMRYNILRDGRRQIVNLILPGDFICAHATLFDAADDNVSTLTGAMLARIERQAALAVFQAFPRLGLAFARACAQEESILRERLVSIGCRSLTERAAHLLLELHARLSLVGLAENGTFEMPVSQAIMADCLGISAVHVSKTMTRLREAGLIEVKSRQPKSIVIRDRAGLEAVAGFRPAYLHLAESAYAHP
jgi:CRP-like cAMP-binding protein